MRTLLLTCALCCWHAHFVVHMRTLLLTCTLCCWHAHFVVDMHTLLFLQNFSSIEAYLLNDFLLVPERMHLAFEDDLAATDHLHVCVCLDVARSHAASRHCAIAGPPLATDLEHLHNTWVQQSAVPRRMLARLFIMCAQTRMYASMHAHACKSPT